MGIVYRAHDTRLKRDVALKVLPPAHMADLERKCRFIQEARVASALNHPNIIAIHDIDQVDGIDFIAMEYVPGKTLAQMIGQKGLPLAEALAYAIPIAGALSAAHAADIVHRDLKPGNVMVTADAQVKVLDFGLAKLVNAGSEDETGSQDETLSDERVHTGAGTVLGTVGYMSPEQVAGRPVDHRADIFSLGVVLYEILAGKRPFEGKSRVEVMHAILTNPAPRLTQYPPELEEIVEKALAKDPNDRYQHVGDLGLDLRRLQQGWKAKSLPSMQGSAVAAPSGRFQWVVLAAVLALGSAAGWWVTRRPAGTRFDNPLANAQFTRLTSFEGAEHSAAVSPDGRWVAFRADRDGPMDVWLTQVGTGQFFNVTKGKVGEDPYPARTVGFSGDGSHISVLGPPERRLQLVPLMGGTPRAFLSAGVIEAAWSADGASLVYHTAEDGDPIFVADRNGSNPARIFVGPRGWHNHFPAWSPDGRWIYCVGYLATANKMDLWRIPLDGGPTEQLTHHATDVVAYPAPIDNRVVLYVARDQDGSGPWLWALEVERRLTHRVSFGLERYTSVAASADGRRLAATVANPSASLWKVSILDRPAEEHDVQSFLLPSVNPTSPRFGGASLFYLSGGGLWRYRTEKPSRSGTALMARC